MLSFCNGIHYENIEKIDNPCGKVADNVLTQEIIDNWPNMTPKEKKVLIIEYSKAIGEILGNGKGLIKKVEFYTSRYGVSYGNGIIKINQGFINGNSNKFSLNKLVDTVTHETEHEHQRDVINNPEKYKVPQSIVNSWSMKYSTEAERKTSEGYDKYWKHLKEADTRAEGSQVWSKWKEKITC